MKKKRKPVLLITLVSTFAVVVVALNMTNLLGSGKGLQKVESPNQEAFDQMLERGRKNVEAKGSSLVNLKQAASAEKTLTPGVVSAYLNKVPERPSILVPGTGLDVAPKYEASRPAGQWFQEDSFEGLEKEKHEEATGGN